MDITELNLNQLPGLENYENSIDDFMKGVNTPMSSTEESGESIGAYGVNPFFGNLKSGVATGRFQPQQYSNQNIQPIQGFSGSSNDSFSNSQYSDGWAKPHGLKFNAGKDSLVGECAYYAEQHTSLGGKNWVVGNSLGEKVNSLANYAKQGLAFYPGQAMPQVGNSIIQATGSPYGHVAMIAEVDPQRGMIRLNESNYRGDKTVTNNRWISINDPSIKGFLKTTPKGGGTGGGDITMDELVAAALAEAQREDVLTEPTLEEELLDSDEKFTDPITGEEWIEAVKENPDGSTYVELEDRFLEGKKKSEFRKEIYDMVRRKFQGKEFGFDNPDDLVSVTKRSAGKLSKKSHGKQSLEEYRNKGEASGALDEIFKVLRNTRFKPNNKKKNENLRGIKKGDAFIKIGDDMYDTTVLAKEYLDGKKAIHDISDWRALEHSPTGTALLSPSMTRQSSSDKRIIPKKTHNVKKGKGGGENLITSEFGDQESFRDEPHTGVDYGIPRGTPVKAPKGKWKVLAKQYFSDAETEGSDQSEREKWSANDGWGNSVTLKNKGNGVEVSPSHLAIGGVKVKPGMELSQGDLIGYSGATGNVFGATGEHVDWRLRDKNGQYKDISKTVYAPQYKG